MIRIETFTFQPFQSRQGRDTVIGLRFAYNTDLVELLKETLRIVRDKTRQSTAGGWLPERKCWFVEHWAWPTVRRRLTAAGVTVEEERSDDYLDETRSNEEWRALTRALQEDNDFMRLLIHDLLEDSLAYARGVRDGVAQAEMRG